MHDARTGRSACHCRPIRDDDRYTMTKDAARVFVTSRLQNPTTPRGSEKCLVAE